ncbi:MAG TPA: hypothetical protein VF447_08380 [Terriglobales bacterium]
MRKACAITFTLFLFGASCCAQIPIPRKATAFFGYSYSGGNVITPSGPAGIGMNGWEGSLDATFLPWLSGVVDLDWHYGGVTTLCGRKNCGAIQVNGSRHLLLFGPRASMKRGSFEPYAQALLGFAHQSDATGSVSVTDLGFASGIGGGVDYKLMQAISWRTQLDWIHTQLFSNGHNNIRFSTGLAFHFSF